MLTGQTGSKCGSYVPSKHDKFEWQNGLHCDQICGLL